MGCFYSMKAVLSGLLLMVQAMKSYARINELVVVDDARRLFVIESFGFLKHGENLIRLKDVDVSYFVHLSIKSFSLVNHRTVADN